MYTPPHFAENDQAVLYSFMHDHPFATLVTQTPDGPIASHIPVDVDQPDRPNAARIFGHMARANPHWEQSSSPANSLLIFHGPHEYISPAWYESRNLPPTWNYASVHAYGRLELMDDPADTLAVLNRLVDRFERDRSNPWENDLDSDLMSQLQAAIVAFEFHVERLEGKFKLSQNRRTADQWASVAGLEDETSNTALIALTRERLKDRNP